MKYLSTLLLILFALNINAQSNLTVFAEDATPFYLILNGVRQNAEAQTNVKVTGLNQPGYKAKVIFVDESLGEIDKNLTVVDVETNQPYDVTYVVKKNKKGNYIVRFFTGMPIAQAPPPAPDVVVVQYNTVPMPPIGTSVQITETTTTSTTVGGSTGMGTQENVNVGVNMGGVNFNMDVNIDVDEPIIESTETISTTTTTTTTNTNMGGFGTVEVYEEVATGCAPMFEGDFQEGLSAVKSKSFEDSKMEIAKQITKGNCLTAKQIKQMMGAFDFEDSRLEYAIFAHGYCYDANNYWQVHDAFTFESSIEELNDAIGR